MSSKAITEQTAEPSAPSWQSRQETAPSILRQEEPTVARYIAGFGLAFVAIGALGMVMTRLGRAVIISGGLDVLCLVLGVAGVLYHASQEKELQLRRLYWVIGLLFMVGAAVLWAASLSESYRGLFTLGSVCSVLSLLFLLAFVRNETDESRRDLTVYVIGGAGVVLAVLAFAGGAVYPAFLWPYGLVFGLLALVFLSAFVAVRGIADDMGYQAGLGLGALGLLVFVLALFRSAIYPLFFTAGSLVGDYLVPTGLLLMGLGLLYACVSVALCSDRPYVVLTRRELAGYFYSPVAYFVLIGLAVVAWMSYVIFVNMAYQSITHMGRSAPMVEPILGGYAFGIFPVICMIFVVPLLTMRLLSEEKRTGTLEVLLTAPVNEVTVVLSKFTAALLFFLIAWLPWVLFLIDLPLNGYPFDGRPLLSFFIALTFMGSAFVGIGLFFSSLTANQIASAVLTGAAMFFWTGLSVILWWFLRDDSGWWGATLKHVSYLQLWVDSLRGMVMPRHLLFMASVAVFALFLTVKVLESRKWR
jgi:ABC-type transport system involved in multi-copper enzyme maturation permease subunit